MVTRAQLISEALTWLDTPWHHRQCLKGVGTDCVRLFEGIAKHFHMLPDSWEPVMYSQTYHLHSDRELVRETLEEFGAVQVPLDTRQPGDLLLFKYGRSCAHAAMLMPDNRVLHAVKRSGCVLQNTLAADLLNRLRYAYQWPDVEDAP